jgi:hypothetical protein
MPETFRLISRRVIDLLKNFEDAQHYLRGTVATLGFKQVVIPYSRNARVLGSFGIGTNRWRAESNSTEISFQIVLRIVRAHLPEP